MEEDFRTFLLGGSALVGEVGPRVSWGERNRGEGLSAIVLHLISAPRTYTMQGRVRLVGRLVQVDCLAKSFAAAKVLARQVIARLDALGDPSAPIQNAFLEAERDDSEAVDGPERGAADTIFRTSLDVRVWSLDA